MLEHRNDWGASVPLLLKVLHPGTEDFEKKQNIPKNNETIYRKEYAV